MHNPTKKLRESPGLVFSVCQYLNSAINIYPTATIIFKFWVLLQQIFCKKGGANFLWKKQLQPNISKMAG